MLKKVKPAIWTGPLAWGWVNLAELAEILGQPAEEIWRRWSLLSKDNDLGVIEVVVKGEEELLTAYGYYQEEGGILEVYDDGKPSSTKDIPCKPEDIWVPAGWGLDIIRAWHAGVRSLEERPWDDKEAAQFKLMSHFEGYVVGRDGEGRMVEVD